MDVGLDKARRHQPPAEIDGFAFGRQPGRDRGDASAGDADVGQRVLGAYRARVPQNEIHDECAPRRPARPLAVTTVYPDEVCVAVKGTATPPS